MDKVLLPKKVADSIHYFQVKGREKSLFNVPTIASCSTRDKRYKVIYDFTQSSDENFKKYFNALVNGYEVEMSKEEQLIKFFDTETNSFHSKAFVILKTLQILEIEIEGVNK